MTGWQCMTRQAFVFLFVLFAGFGLAPAQGADMHPGRALALDGAKGHCIACHGMPTLTGIVAAGNAGPPLIAMSARIPDRARLRAWVWDATALAPGSFMPPYGRHRILSEDEIDLIVDFIYGL